MTALMLASAYGYKEVVEALVRAKVNVNKQNSNVGTLIEPLYFWPTFIIVLFRTIQFGRTALMYASRRGHTKVAEFLLQSGANPNLINAVNAKALEAVHLICSANTHC